MIRFAHAHRPGDRFARREEVFRQREGALRAVLKKRSGQKKLYLEDDGEIFDVDGRGCRYGHAAGETLFRFKIEIILIIFLVQLHPHGEALHEHEDRRRDAAHPHHRNLLGDLFAEVDGGHVRDHHPERRPHDHPDGLGRVARRHGDRGDLGLVPHFREEEEHDGRPEDAVALRPLLVFVVFDLVGNQNPHGHREEGDDEDPAQEFFRNEGGERRAEKARERVVEERRKEKQRKDVLRESIACCYAGTVKERQFVKQFIYRLLTGQTNVYMTEYDNGGVNITANNYKYIFPWDNPYRLPTQVKFLGIIYNRQDTLGADTFDYIVSKYKLNRLRDINVMQGDSKQSKGIFISAQDVDAIFEGEKVVFDYSLAMDVLVQLIYEEFKGNGCIDELLYQNIDDVGIGLSGLQNDVEPIHLRGKKVKKAYEGVWIKHRGLLMNLTFLSFHSFSNLRRVVNQLVAYDMQGSFSEKDGFKMGYGKDGSRRTSVITPFAENPAAWVRKFTASSLTNRQLITNNNALYISGVDDLIAVEKALVQGGATIPICGPQGVGKTTALEAITEYVQNWYAIRMIESEFEARIRWRYPEKNILTVQTPVISPERAYEFTLRTSGDIYIIAEVRSDEMMVNITRTANRGGRSVIFTYHPNKPRATIIEVANSLIRQKLYTSLKDAMYTTLETIKCCIHIDLDLERQCRYYNVYEYVPTDVELDDSFLNMSGAQRSEAFMETQLTYYKKTIGDRFFDAVPIIVFDKSVDGYVFKNNISDRLYEDLYRGSSLDSEKETLEKLFRPQQYLLRLLKDKHEFKYMSVNDLEDLAAQEGLNKAFIDFESIQNLKGVYGSGVK